MTAKRALPFLVFTLAILACSIFTPRPAPVAPTLPAEATVKPPIILPIPTGALPAATVEPPIITLKPTEALPTAEGLAEPEGQSACPAVSCPAGTGETQPIEIKGSFQFSNDIIIKYYVENAVSLTDMYGFVRRDKEWAVPLTSQNLGYLQIDTTKKTGTFDIRLPAAPQGTLVDVNPDGKDEKGVQIFAAEYFPNLTGSPYAVGDDLERGWPSYLASVKIDTENKDEVTGGKLLIWSPDDKQFFPDGFGSDGLLFTQDDPVMPVPAGYTVIDLDQKPFKVIRDTVAEMTLYEPKDAAIKDFSTLSYTEAFDQMFAIVRKEYAFNGIQGKQPDWDALYAKISPMVAAASQNKDAEAYYKALRDFTLAFKDGHVGLDGGDPGRKVFNETVAGGYGFAVRQLDDGTVIVVHVVNGSPAAAAGMKTGAVVTQFNGKPINAAIQAVIPPSGPFSQESTLRYEQARYLVRAPIGTKATVTFQNDGESQKNATLETIDERETLQVTSPYQNVDPNGLPVYYQVATDKIGYISIDSNYDDLNLIMRLFQRALEKFKENNLDTLVIDLRVNSGGAPLGLAGFLYNKEITMGQLQYYSEKTGKFENEGDPQRVTPNQEQYHFAKMYLLVGQACASACELEAYGFSKVPGMVVVGETSTSGTEAEVARGQFKLPEGMSMQIPTGRFVLPDGSLFLEGVGVQPTDRVPVTKETVLSSRDPVIQRVLQLASQ
jgi:C-terminal processing protease CtpA/Prc